MTQKCVAEELGISLKLMSKCRRELLDDTSQPTSARGMCYGEIERLQAELAENNAEIEYLNNHRVRCSLLEIRYAMIDDGGLRLLHSRCCLAKNPLSRVRVRHHSKSMCGSVYALARFAFATHTRDDLLMLIN